MAATATAPAPPPAGGPGGAAGIVGAGSGRHESPLAWIDDLIDRVRAATRPVLEDDWTVLVLERAASAAAEPPAATAG